MKTNHTNPYMMPIKAKRRRRNKNRDWEQLDLFDDIPKGAGAIVNDLSDLVAIRTDGGGLRFAEVVEARGQ